MFPLANGEDMIRQRRKLIADEISGLPTKGSWDTPDELTIEGAGIMPSSSVEVTGEGSQRTITKMSLYCETGLDIQPMDRIKARSGIWEVQGELQDYRSGFTGWSPGSEFAVEKAPNT